MKHLDAYKLKWIAIIGMVLSHMFYAWWDIMPFWLILVLSGLGGLTFPIMSFFVVEGFYVSHADNGLYFGTPGHTAESLEFRWGMDCPANG